MIESKIKLNNRDSDKSLNNKSNNMNSNVNSNNEIIFQNTLEKSIDQLLELKNNNNKDNIDVLNNNE